MSGRHGEFYRNEYGRYYHGKWFSMRQECCGCALWIVLGLAVFFGFIWYALPAMNH